MTHTTVEALKTALAVIGRILIISAILAVVVWVFAKYVFPVLFCAIFFLPWFAAALKDGANM